MTRPTLVLLHALGGSARGWDGVRAALGPAFACLALDLPGFGGNASPRTRVVEMLDWLQEAVAPIADAPWMPVGHSMGGKLATLIAARAEAGALPRPAGVVLLAASPPSPEPMDEDRRREMIAWFTDGPASDADARAFVDANVAAPLPPERMAAAVADVRRSSPAAWIDWLERGSREDWSDHAGRLSPPALIVAGAEDGDLGEPNQRVLNLPHYADATVEVVADAAHLLPQERPEAVARLVASHARRVS